jgi:hypothetical protein
MCNQQCIITSRLESVLNVTIFKHISLCHHLSFEYLLSIYSMPDTEE